MKEHEVIQELFTKGFTPKNVFFVACGGSLLAQYPAFYLLQRESATIDAQIITSNEFVHATPKSLGKDSLAIFCSLSGTPETMKAAEVAKSQKAKVISYCSDSEAKMSKIADYHISFKTIFDPDTKYMESNAGPILKLGFELLHFYESYEFYEDALKSFENLQTIVERAASYIEPRAKKFAKEHQNDRMIVPMAGGPALGVAYGFSICSLMEMQWIVAPLINTGEFFHGPFEIIDRTLPIVLFISEGRNREIDIRAKKFLQKYAENVFILDAKELFINEFPESVAEFFNHFVFDTAQRRLLDNLATERVHETTVRRYMWQVEY